MVVQVDLIIADVVKHSTKQDHSRGLPFTLQPQCFDASTPLTVFVSSGPCAGLDIGLVGPVARGASRFENLLAPQKTNWSLPQNQTCATKNYLHKPTICT